MERSDAPLRWRRVFVIGAVGVVLCAVVVAIFATTVVFPGIEKESRRTKAKDDTRNVLQYFTMQGSGPLELRMREFVEVSGLAPSHYAWREGVARGSGPHAVLAHVGLPDGVVFGYANGSVRFLDRSELGLTDDDPIRVGPEAKSLLLRPFRRLDG